MGEYLWLITSDIDFFGLKTRVVEVSFRLRENDNESISFCTYNGKRRGCVVEVRVYI